MRFGRVLRVAATVTLLAANGFETFGRSEPPVPSPELRLARGEDGKVVLRFTPVADAKTYAVRIMVGGKPEIIDNVEVTDYTVHGLTEGHSYRFAVCAVIEGRPGPWSNELSAVPAGQPSWHVLQEAFNSNNPTRNSNPFLMVHGRESEAQLRAILRAAYDAGFEGVTLHPYNYEGYLGPGQWDRWKIIFDQARRLGLVVWQQDDQNYPSGFAANKVVATHPEFGRTVLVQAADRPLAGVQQGFSLDVSSLLKGRDFLVAVCAYPEKGEPLDLTDRVQQGKLVWNVPAGKWRLFVIKAVWSNGSCTPPTSPPRGYIDFLNPKAVDAYIEAIYGATHRQFPKEFGRTFKGFFSDEAPVEFGQFTPDLLARFEKAKGYSIRRYLPSLWHDLGPLDRKVRGDYRDFIREQNATVFFRRSRQWCHEHDVQLIGHVIEDHQQDMRRLESLDIPGCDSIFSQWSDPEGDVYWRQTKMASSVAHYAGSRNDLALIEHFAATGWRMGLSEMKRMMDWSTVMGLNQIVPCGLDTQSPPVWEVAPEFWLRGQNPQWPYFREYQTTANRMTMMMRGGRHVAPAIVLDTTESQWVKDGKDVAWQHGARDALWKTCAAMCQSQVDFDLIPYAVFADGNRTKFNNGRIHIGKEDYAAVILPPVESIPASVVKRLRELSEAGGVAVAVERTPTQSCDGQQDDLVCTMVRQLWNSENPSQKSVVASYDKLGATLTKCDVPDVRVSPQSKKLLYCHRRLHGKDLYFFDNTGTDPITPTVELRGTHGVPMLWNPVDGRIAPAASYSNRDNAIQLKLELGEYESTFVVIEPDADPTQAPATSSRATVVAQGPWHGKPADKPHHRLFSTDVRLPADWSTGSPATLELRGASQILSVTVNGKPVGHRFCSPYRFEVGKYLQPGQNNIQIERVGRIVLPNQIAPPTKEKDDQAASPFTQATIYSTAP